MRLLTIFCLATGFSSVAIAHELPGHDSSLLQLLHQGLSPHHLPALILLLIAGMVLYRWLRRDRKTAG